MFKDIKKKWLIAGGIVFLLIITNPSLRSFKEYQGLSPTRTYYSIKRKYNFFIFSIYTDSGNQWGTSTYLGVFGNFFDLTIKRSE